MRTLIRTYQPRFVAVLTIVLLLITNHWPIAAVIATGLYIMLFAWQSGTRFIPTGSISEKLSFGILGLISYYAILGTLLFYTVGHSPLIRVLLLVGSLLLIFPRAPEQVRIVPRLRIPSFSLTTAVSCCMFLGLIVYVFLSQTERSVVSPWLILPQIIFVIFFVACIGCITALAISKKNTILPLVLLYCTAICVATIIFPLGYGFDPFIHQATERLLLTTGTISPAPLYYIGYYSLITLLTAASRLPLAFVDRFTVLLVAAFVLPTCILYSFRQIPRIGERAWISVLLFLLIPVSSFIQSTPQAMSFLLAVTALLLCIPSETVKRLPRVLPLAIALAALTMHPLTGVPTVLFTVYRLFEQGVVSLTKKALRLLTALIGLTIVPILLMIAARFVPALGTSVHYTSSIWLTDSLGLYRYSTLPDLVYSYGAIVPMVIILGGCTATWWLRRQKDIQMWSFTLWSLILIANAFFLTSFVRFSFITLTEQNTFAARLLMLGLYFMFAPCSIAAALGIQKMMQSSALQRMSIVILLAVGLTASWYLSYPRFDVHMQSKGYTASRDDLNAITRIEQQQVGTPYIVLANQTVSGLAIATYGFAHYYNGSLYYPLPTSGPLYQQYLDLVEERMPVDRIMSDIKKNTGVSTVYLILDNYWNNADIVARDLEKKATQSITIGSSVHLFQFQAS